MKRTQSPSKSLTSSMTTLHRWPQLWNVLHWGILPYLCNYVEIYRLMTVCKSVLHQLFDELGHARPATARALSNLHSVPVCIWKRNKVFAWTFLDGHKGGPSVTRKKKTCKRVLMESIRRYWTRFVPTVKSVVVMSDATPFWQEQFRRLFELMCQQMPECVQQLNLLVLKVSRHNEHYQATIDLLHKTAPGLVVCQSSVYCQYETALGASILNTMSNRMTSEVRDGTVWGFEKLVDLFTEGLAMSNRGERSQLHLLSASLLQPLTVGLPLVAQFVLWCIPRLPPSVLFTQYVCVVSFWTVFEEAFYLLVRQWSVVTSETTYAVFRAMLSTVRTEHDAAVCARAMDFGNTGWRCQYKNKRMISGLETCYRNWLK